MALGTSSTSDVDGSPVPGNGFHTRFADDLGALAAHGITHLRLGFDWSRLQPRSGMGDELNGEWVEWYRDVLSAARASGIEVWAGLLE
ncbi:MAG: family 1 glycosylhydrolase, partial [Ilumatobacteraceae bacterium]